MNKIIGYGLYGDRVGFYADVQPNYEYSFTQELNKAKIWKTLSFDNELQVIIQKYDSSVRVVKIECETIITLEEEDDPFDYTPFELELFEWDMLLTEYNTDAENMSNKDYNRFRKLKPFVKYFGTVREPDDYES